MTALFIVGTGRTGKRFLCRSLLQNKNIVDFLDGKEDTALLEEVTKRAIAHEPLPPIVLDHYDRMIAKAPSYFVDQCHPNLWHVTQLATRYPDAFFLYPYRSTANIVSSMLRHKGHRARFDSLNLKSPFPNRFFGVDTRDDFHTADILEKCVRRVVSHKREARRMHLQYPGKFIPVDYERLALHHESYLSELFARMAIGNEVSEYLPIKIEGLNNCARIDAADISRIESIEATLAGDAQWADEFPSAGKRPQARAAV